MTRVLSGAVLIAIAVAVVWFASNPVFLVVAIAFQAAAVVELIGLGRVSGMSISTAPALIASCLVAAVIGAPASFALEACLMTALIGSALVTLSAWRGGPGAFADVAASLFPALYIGLPIGAMIGIRTVSGPQVLFLLMLTIIVSDTAQYYSGRLFGRRPLAPLASPKKTIEGAVGGFVLGTAAFAIIASWWLPIAMPFRIMLGLTIVGLGIAGDLFESMLKRSAGVKDSSALIPGHGGVLDRIDALLFAAPVYYIVLKYV
jgi:phosphatidate cytidylyltransferase